MTATMILAATNENDNNNTTIMIGNDKHGIVNVHDD